MRKNAKNPRFAPFIRLMGHVERGKALEAQYNATALLLMESSHPRARGVLTGKLLNTSYLADLSCALAADRI